MRKEEFLRLLKKELSFLPKDEIKDCLAFYNEMIDNRIEEGMSEEEAVKDIGSIEDIVKQIVYEKHVNKDKIKRKLKTGEIALLAVGSPIWLSLLIAFLVIIISVYISLWVVVISLWSVFVSLIAGSFIGLFLFFIYLFKGKIVSSLVWLGLSFVCLSLGIFFYYICKEITKMSIKLTKYCFSIIKNKCKGKEKK